MADLKPLMEKIPTYVGECCREWVLALGVRGRCGICNQVPFFVRREED